MSIGVLLSRSIIYLPSSHPFLYWRPVSWHLPGLAGMALFPTILDLPLHYLGWPLLQKGIIIPPYVSP